MGEYRIAVIPGDGVGPEVIREGVKVLRHVASLTEDLSFSFVEFPWGCEFYRDTGVMMPEDGIEQLSKFDAVYLGAVGFPGVPDHVSLWGLLLPIRKRFEQYVNLRPIRLLNGAPCPLKDAKPEDIRMTFIRENTEGEYAGEGNWLFRGKPEEVVLQNGVFSRRGCTRVIRHAYELARTTGQTLTSVSKANALNYSMVFWDQIFNEVGREYPDVETRSLLVDAAAMFMIQDPKRFQVVVTSNLFGDILTDLGAAITGGMGLAAGANINPEREHPSMFEPVHGSAPDIAGKGLANPLAAIWSASQLLDFLGQEDSGRRVLDAVERLMVERKTLTPDMGGSAATGQVGDAIIASIK